MRLDARESETGTAKGRMTNFDEYYEAEEPGRRERALGWATAIGLQQVDGLSPSDYLIRTARRNIEGEITGDEARRLVDEYYETRLGHEEPTGHQEADKVSARMSQLIHAPVFGMTPEFFIGLHGKIFEGVFSHAGQIRDVELLKREWVLNGDSVQYEASFLIERALERHFEREQAFKYKGLSDDAFVHHFSAFISRLWQIHPFREGNTRTTALMAIKYLRFMRYDVSNDLFARQSYYFRNALVCANYDNRRLDVERTLTPLEEFFKVLVFGEELELHSRYLKIGQEYGTPAANAMANFHRRAATDENAEVGINVGINVGIKTGSTEELAVKAILRNPRITAAELASVLSVSQRQTERILATLKKTAGLRRQGARKNGEWRFEETTEGSHG